MEDVKFVSRRELEQLSEHLPRLYSLIMKYHPLFVVPSQIRTLRLEGNIRSTPINHLSHRIPYVKTLQIQIHTKDQMIRLIEHIDDFLFMFDDLDREDHLKFFIEKLHFHW